MKTEQQVRETTEVRRHNGQCAYGPWIQLTDAPAPVQRDVIDEIFEAISRQMRREPAEENTDETGEVRVGSELWLYRR